MVLNRDTYWQAFKQMWQMTLDTFTNPPPFSTWAPVLNVLIPLIIVPIMLWKIPKLRKRIWEIIGEGKSSRPSWYRQSRFVFPFFFSIPFVFYVLSSGVTESVPPVIQFSLLAIAPTLGGLVLTAATRLHKKERVELVSVAKKLIVATVLLIAFASLSFTSDLTGGANPSALDWSATGFFRWFLLWGSVWTFYLGIYLFLQGISDLVISLRLLGK
jgi:hypothetical protein